MGKKVEIENIERLEMMEEKFGVSVEGAYAEYLSDSDDDDGWLMVRGEIQSTAGTTIESDIDIVFTAYNSSGKVILSSSFYFSSEDFFGIAPFDGTYSIIEKPVKIRIYPKKG